jgi:hypothetical protein
MTLGSKSAALKRLASAVQLRPWPPSFRSLSTPVSSVLLPFASRKFNSQLGRESELSRPVPQQFSPQPSATPKQSLTAVGEPNGPERLSLPANRGSLQDKERHANNREPLDGVARVYGTLGHPIGLLLP